MKIKRILCLGMTVLLTCSNLPQMGVFAQGSMVEDVVMEMAVEGEDERVSDKKVEDYQYERLEDGTLEITGYTGNDTEIVIPAEIDGKSVTIIGEEAFYDCSKLTSITIPEGVTDIKLSAFASCSSLASVIIPKSVTSIGIWAFYECSSLTSVSIPSSVTSIGSYTF